LSENPGAYCARATASIFLRSHDRCKEYFKVESWLAHLRQHERVTTADRHVQESARPFHIGENEPVVTHYIAAGSQHR